MRAGGLSTTSATSSTHAPAVSASETYCIAPRTVGRKVHPDAANTANPARPAATATFRRVGRAVIFSEVDVVEGLLGTPIFEADGYTPASAYELMRNIVLYAEKH